MTKRLFDLIAAGLGVLALAPVFAAIALWVKLDSPGPVLFRQERVGQGGRLFRIRKFRTMRADAPALGPQITVGADARITRAGRFLRAAKLDELPQLVDVLQGTMSLVGPRPEVPRYVAHYPSEVRAIVLSVRPGITDLASIEYRDESAVLAAASDPEFEYLNVVLPAKLALARRYVETRSLWGDVCIILRTLGAVFR
jgi:lipopolysaccharide/colanic/teichoic acid biosynthesis glycosyltransferase